MPNKLQELTDKLYNEGLSKGKEEGELLLAKAKEESADMLQKAKAEAAAIIEAAEKAAAELKSKAESDIRMASAQSLLATKNDIESLLSGAVISDKVNSVLAGPDFVKEIIKTVAEKFSTSEACGLSLVLPDSLKNDLEPWVSGELAKSLGKEVKADFSKKVSGGFTIGPKDGGWFVSLTDETFKSLIAEYLRPVTKKILFG